MNYLKCSTDGMILTARNRITRRNPCPNATSSKISPTMNGLELNPGLRVGTPTTNCMSHGSDINPLNPKLNPICYLLALLAHNFLHVSRIRVKSLTLRLLMSYIYTYIYIYIYIYGAPILDVSRSHTTTQHSR